MPPTGLSAISRRPQFAADTAWAASMLGRGAAAAPRRISGPVRSARPAPVPEIPGMLGGMAVWVGVDVGGKRKGFDVAVIDDRRVLALQGHLACQQVVDLVAEDRPA